MCKKTQGISMENKYLHLFLIFGLSNPNNLLSMCGVGQSVWHLADQTCEHVQTVVSLLDILDDGATLNGTYTVLTAISEKIRASESALEFIESSVDELIISTSQVTDSLETLTGNINQDFVDTYTVLSEIIENLTSILDEISIDNNEFLSIQDLLEDSLQRACTIESRLDALDTSTTDFNGTFTLLNALEQIVCTIESKLDLLTPCSAIPISGPTTITEPGSYGLTTDILGPIVITGSDIDLNLNGYSITAVLLPDLVDCIDIFSSQNVRIHNGTLINEVGVFQNSNLTIVDSKNIVIENITCDNGGPAITIIFSNNIIINNCLMNGGFAGIALDNVNSSIFNNCHCTNSVFQGFSIGRSSNLNFIQCTVSGINGTDANFFLGVAGFTSTGGTNNLFYRCKVENINSFLNAPPGSLGALGIDAVGFQINGQEVGTRLIDCIVNGARGSSNTDANGYGILFQEEFNNDFTGVLSVFLNYDLTAFTTVNSVAWSSDGQFILLGGIPNANPNLQIFEFTNYGLHQLNTLFFPTSISSVAWSNGNQNLALAPSTTPNIIDVYNYNAQVLTFSNSRDHGAQVNAVQWNPQNTLIAAVGEENAQGYDIRLFEPGSNPAMDALETHGAPLNSASWAADGTLLVVGGEESGGSEIVLFDTTVVTPGLNNALPRTNVTQGATVLSVAFPPQKYIFAAAGLSDSNGDDIKLYRTSRTNNLEVILYQSFAHGAPVHSIAWSNSGNFIITGGETAPDGAEVRLWYFVPAGLFLLFGSFSHGATVNSVSFSPSNESIVIAGEPSTIDGQSVRILYTGFETPQECVVKNCIVSGVFGGTNGAGSVGLFADSSNNLVINNFIDLCNRSYGIGTFNFTRTDALSEIVGSLENIDGINLINQ